MSSDSTESTDESTEETYVLTTMTEEQMDDLVTEGKITKAEENAELERRATEKVQQNQPQDTKTERSVDNGMQTYNNQALLSNISSNESGLLLNIVA